MNEFIEKLIGRLEEEKKQYHKQYVDDCIGYTTYHRYEHELDKIIEIVNQLAEEYDNDVCEWKQHEREIDVYFTECGQAHIFVNGNPEENNYEYCPYCGKKIKIVGD